MTMMWGGGWWFIGAIVMLACMYLMARMMMGHGGSEHGGHGEHGDGGGSRSARDILAERFARGEISEEEFEERRRVLEHRAS
jgi:putative membrane protein